MSDKTESKTDTKQKLTLGISKAVIDKAKSAGINISEITEQLLTAMTFSPKGNTRDDVVAAYKVFFDAIQVLLAKYGAEVQVGRIILDDPHSGIDEEWDVHLGRKTLYKESFDRGIPIYKEVSNVEDVLDFLSSPKEILENLIKQLTAAAEENQRKLAELDFARRLIKTLDDEGGEQKKS